MKDKLSFEDIYIAVEKQISQALRVKPEKIKPVSKLFSELGAESLDILDIRFRLEKEFGIKIQDGEILASFGENLANETIDAIFTVQKTAEFVEFKLSGT